MNERRGTSCLKSFIQKPPREGTLWRAKVALAQAASSARVPPTPSSFSLPISSINLLICKGTYLGIFFHRRLRYSVLLRNPIASPPWAPRPLPHAPCAPTGHSTCGFRARNPLPRHVCRATTCPKGTSTSCCRAAALPPASLLPSCLLRLS